MYYKTEELNSLNESEYKRHTLEQASSQLADLGLGLEDLRYKTVLDAGSGNSFIAQAVEYQRIDANVYSLDLEIDSNNKYLSKNVREKSIEGDIKTLPFDDNTFDLIICHSVGFGLILEDGPRVLKFGGQIRVDAPVPYDDFVYEYMKNFATIDEQNLLESIEQKFSVGVYTDEDLDIWDYYAEVASEHLSLKTKEEIIQKVFQRDQEMYGIPLTYKIISFDGLTTVVYIFDKT